MSDPSIPDLVSSLLPPSAPATSRRFLRRWLLVPPPPDVAGAMSDLVSHLLRSDLPLPPGVASAPSLTGRVVSLISQRQASAAVYRDVVAALDAASTALREGDGEVVRPLLDVLRHDTGIAVSCPEDLAERLGEARREIDAVVVRGDGRDGADAISDHGDAVPPAFFERNEAIWRGRVRPSVLTESDHVRTAARALAEAVAEDFLGVPRGDGPGGDGDDRPARAAGRKNPVAQDVFNNILGLRDPTQALVIMGMETSKKDKAPTATGEDRGDG
ncbi:hypothetical protein THAOC_26676 [Thalassiosira oceanica]|uniref:Uncharacterized protein n=1 Tax=Thalassiosira oceanica TaxID=159749 RepID=K0S4I9_THAOC|nr:hypothetical protein THAOC_26676 [Thalassiosira oceanica]|eukprot:EJK53807.1 hypothetical protein THAOC_26676 [Thalassiosira oceanica]